MNRYCRHCGDWVPHDAPSAICGRCACLPVAERGRAQTTPPPAQVPGSDDAPEGSQAPRIMPEDEQARRNRLHGQRVEFVRAAWERGRRALLARALDPTRADWAAPKPLEKEDRLDRWRALAAEFAPGEVRVRPQGSRQVQFITARTVMNRLDEVLGPANWWDEYTPLENSVICRLTIRLPDGTTLTKSDAGGYAGMADSGDDDKSGFSDAFKRAAVKFGIGRYLYRDGVPHFAAVG